MTIKYQVEGWNDRDPMLGRISDEYKVNYLARMLAGYDDDTWNHMKAHRKRTYQHAAALLLHNRKAFEEQFTEWDAFEKQVAENNERRRRELAPGLEASIEKMKEEIRNDPRNRVPEDY